MEKFKFLSHTADIKFQAYGKSLSEAFSNAGYALVNSMCKEKISEQKKKQIRVEGTDYENLLYNFLEEFLFLLDSENFILARVRKIKISEKKDKTGKEKHYELYAEISGDEAANYEFNLDVKAVTYNEMFVKGEKNKYVCQVVLDV